MEIYVLSMCGDGYSEDMKVFKDLAEAQKFIADEVVEHWGEDLEGGYDVPVEELRKFVMNWFTDSAYLFVLSDEFVKFVRKWDSSYSPSDCHIEHSWWNFRKFDI